ncbi:ABC transporter ATP-binding protein [Cytophagales bacterium LB-30]|uniref:ABC transporter ATP-binding protein n=1 Tax=Shiella aurantiaca TaxID=3058365 RepID=A0ABT8F747_9BACT|nr:ABC transporter ATP-binding protein [Shiella aurantiaca]MDN4166297.1 ABC transporter ATP-binding protein [Shiella aurantiaca]
MRTSSSIVTTESLSIGYAHQPALMENLNLEVQRGKLTALLGPNGIGKTTLLRTLSGIHAPMKGKVLFKNTDLAQYTRQQIAKEISLVLTDKPALWSTTVYELVSFGRYPYSSWIGQLSPLDHQKIEEAIQLTHIDFLRHHAVDTLSDGQLQKVMIARALAQDGDLLLLDEPTAHLDLGNKIEIFRLLRTLALKTQKAIVISTHELELAIEMTDCLWVLSCGADTLVGTPEELLLSGALSQRVSGKEYILNELSGKFEIAHPAGPELAIEGNPKAAQWLAHFLRKNGFTIVPKAAQTLHITDSPLQISLNNHVFDCFDDVIQALNKG